MDAQDDEWLLEYQRDESERAFEQLVSRYLRLVHGCAARQAGSQPHLLEDIVQRVFIDFAREARRMKPGGNIGGWLHRHACFIAGSALRAEKRRRLREQNFDCTESDPESAWKQIGPVVDEAVNALRHQDRLALVLRFFEQRDLHAVGAALGVSEDAAQKRVTRALEKLRLLLARRGVALSCGLLTAALANTSASAPIASAAAISAIALSTAGASAGIVGIFHFLVMNKTKIAVATALVAAAGGATAVVQSIRAKEAENITLRNRLAELQAATRPLDAEQIAISAAELSRLRADQSEAIKLRGDLVRARQELANANELAAEAARSRASAESANAGEPAADLPRFRVRQTKASATMRIGESLLLGGWQSESNTVTYAFVTPTTHPDSDIVILSAQLVEVDRASAAADMLNVQTNAEGNVTFDAGTARDLIDKWKETAGLTIRSAPRVMVGSGHSAKIQSGETRQISTGALVDVGPEINFLAALSADRSQVRLDIESTYTELLNPGGAAAQ